MVLAKEGIDSFILDCHTNENISEIEALFGIKGFALIVRLWQKIYSEKGYYCEWLERSPLLFLSNWFGGNSGVELNLITEVVEAALRIGIFDAGLYEKYSILTSKGIQKRYFDVVKRRTELTVISEYLLVSVDNFKGYVNRNSISVSKNGKNACRNVTSKVKESKVKESKEKSIECVRTPTPKSTMRDLIDQTDFSKELKSVVKDWASYKTENRQSYKETGFRKLLTEIGNRVDRHGEKAVIEVINLSMSNNWKGIIWDRIKDTKNISDDDDYYNKVTARLLEESRR